MTVRIASSGRVVGVGTFARGYSAFFVVLLLLTSLVMPVYWDSARAIVIVVWVVTAFMIGLFVRSMWIGVCSVGRRSNRCGPSIPRSR